MSRGETYKNLSSDEYLILQEYKNEFGMAEYRSMLKNFGRNYDDVTELSSVKMERCFSMMIDQLNTLRMMKGNSYIKKNKRLVMDKTNTKLERVWVTATGRKIPISRMDDDHLNNTILFIDRRLAEGQWQIGLNKDPADLLKEMEAERVLRGMPLPLLSIKSLAYRKGELK